MADLHLELLRRNAWFRAWKAHGAPVEALWCMYFGTPQLSLACLCCDARTQGLASWSSRCGGYDEKQLIKLERDQLRKLLGQGRWNKTRILSSPTLCAHLEPLLKKPPPEVLAIFELELLAGA
jgi:hypothetical protein